MTNLAIKATLSALLVSVPLTGAFAQTLRDTAHRAPAVAVDTFQTSSIGAAASRSSHARQIDSSLRAAEATARTFDGSAAVRVRSDVQAIRQAVNAEKQANGGELSASAYQSLSGDVQALHQRVETLRNLR